MGAIASQITSLKIVYSTVYWYADQRKHQSSASLAFVLGIQRRPVNSPHKWPVTRKNASIWWRHHVPFRSDSEGISQRVALVTCQFLSYITMCNKMPLLWRHNEHDGVSNHQPYDCLLNRLFRQRKHQSSAPLAFVWAIHRWPVNSPHKGPITRKMFPFDDVIMIRSKSDWLLTYIYCVTVITITTGYNDLILLA